MGFEPTVPCGITGFQDQLLKPLGHLSIKSLLSNDLIIISQKIKNRNPFVLELRFMFGGEREIRTLAPVSRPTPLAGEPLHLLGYFSVSYRRIILYHKALVLAIGKILILCEQAAVILAFSPFLDNLTLW